MNFLKLIKVSIFFAAHFFLIFSLIIVGGKQNIVAISFLIFPIAIFFAGIILELVALLPRGGALLSTKGKVKAIRCTSKAAYSVKVVYFLGVIILGGILYLRGTLEFSSWFYWACAGLIGIGVYFFALTRFLRRI